ncbi:hypothetical protein CLV90_1616 [Maribacter spongiicola]|uniref:Uncharacterized protein n=1 Tax=Maribacter spongiicola TaxID=1206753 RepID=A0A4R7K8W1_9FLAO|nr:hypothetical protein [Maribacter spongiicola]TDT47540.1 hypothetical protein CLV90_1616 [Maribacter spongiicola]
MKALVTLLIIIFAGALAIAQTPQTDDKINTTEVGVVLVDSSDNTGDEKKIQIIDETSVARLYRYANARVNKELAFATQKSYGKLA